jgi:hypothetical protein
MFQQLLAGTAVSFVNFGIHAVMTGLIVVSTRRTAAWTDHLHVFARVTALLMVTMVALTVAHSAEIGIWALFYDYADVTAKTGTNAFEFAFENYTALGYGDAVPLPARRLYGPLAALNGLLLIGWSVAIIFEVMRMAEVQVTRKDGDVRGKHSNSEQ